MSPRSVRASLARLFSKHAIVIAALVVWCPVVGIGLVTLLSYSNTPGPSAVSPAEWPIDSAIQPPAGRPMLVMFAHPQCPCSTASVAELARIMARSHDAVDAVVFVFAPSDAPPDWTRTSLRDRAAAIPGVRVLEDHDAIEARRFGVFTSGQTILYDGQRRRVFSGGITAMRGHQGDNDGEDTIVEILDGGHASRRSTPVFGCILVPNDEWTER